MGEIFKKFIYTFLVTSLQFRPLDSLDRFLSVTSQTMQSHAGCAFSGLENSELIISQSEKFSAKTGQKIMTKIVLTIFSLVNDLIGNRSSIKVVE